MIANALVAIFLTQAGDPCLSFVDQARSARANHEAAVKQDRGYYIQVTEEDIKKADDGLAACRSDVLLEQNKAKGVRDALASGRKVSPEWCLDLPTKAEGDSCWNRYLSETESEAARRNLPVEMVRCERLKPLYDSPFRLGPTTQALIGRCRQAELEGKTAEETERHRRVDPLWSDATHAIRALSMMLCHNAISRAETRRNIATERKYSREGGVVDLTKMHDLQEELREADEADATIHRSLASLHLKALSCSSGPMKPLVQCEQARALETEGPESCSAGVSAEVLSMVSNPGQLAFMRTGE